MPEVGIVCGTSSVADIDGVEAVFNEVAGDDPKVEDVTTHRCPRCLSRRSGGLLSARDVRGTLGDLFGVDDSDVGVGITLVDVGEIDGVVEQAAAGGLPDEGGRC